MATFSYMLGSEDSRLFLWDWPDVQMAKNEEDYWVEKLVFNTHTQKPGIDFIIAPEEEEAKELLAYRSWVYNLWDDTTI
mgnify:CR=1 FL=1